MKANLIDKLRERFGRVETDVSFPWLVVPHPRDLPNEVCVLRDALVAQRGYSNFDTPGYSLRCDYFLPGEKTIIEVDERQHFTAARSVALQTYPPRLLLGFELLRHQRSDAALAELARVHVHVRDALKRWVPEARLVEVAVTREDAILQLRVRFRPARRQGQATEYFVSCVPPVDCGSCTE